MYSHRNKINYKFAFQQLSFKKQAEKINRKERKMGIGHKKQVPDIYMYQQMHLIDLRILHWKWSFRTHGYESLQTKSWSINTINI